MGKISEYEEYFREMARKYVPIGHTEDNPRFWTLSQAEVMAARRSKLNLNEWNLILLNFEANMTTNNSRMYRWLSVGSFEIVRDVSRDDTKKVTTKDIALDFCREIVAKMMTDYKEKVFTLGFLKEETIEFYPINKEFDNCVGFGVSFQWDEGFSRTELVKQENWIV